MADDKLFRKAALDKLASPERLDVLMQVSPPADWLARVTILALMGAGLAWGFFGSVPERIPGEGELRGGGGIQTIQAGGEGILSSFTLAPNGQVVVGQNVATISSSGTQIGLEAALASVQEADRQLAAARATTSGTIGDLESQRRIAQGQFATEQAAYNSKKPLVDSKDLPPAVLKQHESAMSALTARMSDLGIQINQQRSIVQAAESRLRQAKIDLDKIQNVNTEVAEVKSAIAGRVVQVLKQRGDRVNKGDVLAEIETEAQGQALQVVAFVPVTFGRKIVEGLPVQITVAGIKREESGFLKGRVTYFSDSPVGADKVAAVTKESKGGTASYELRVEPMIDPETISGYAWSTGKGPPQQISGGVQVQVAVEVGERTPISQFLPFLRGLFGA